MRKKQTNWFFSYILTIKTLTLCEKRRCEIFKKGQDSIYHLMKLWCEEYCFLILILISFYPTIHLSICSSSWPSSSQVLKLHFIEILLTGIWLLGLGCLLCWKWILLKIENFFLFRLMSFWRRSKWRNFLIWVGNSVGIELEGERFRSGKEGHALRERRSGN